MQQQNCLQCCARYCVPPYLPYPVQRQSKITSLKDLLNKDRGRWELSPSLFPLGDKIQWCLQAHTASSGKASTWFHISYIPFPTANQILYQQMLLLGSKTCTISKTCLRHVPWFWHVLWFCWLKSILPYSLSFPFIWFSLCKDQSKGEATAFWHRCEMWQL